MAITITDKLALELEKTVDYAIVSASIQSSD
ncbi:hypothetical protein SAMN05421752_11934 [Natronorubrum thiooxidans]|uniref:Uncharacterized protein n=1 Tax=Natronorubrum thiooxidans TaxID=308853 RepID=A0A1N7H098_9EURY|nr:hypothetical protein SAMN05421752_11934 [Natronorubrum thiooxidans]